ncbi:MULTISPECIES: AAA family ATPase [Bacteria][Archaea]|uniref:AAA family ATPase n=1 Tax=Bacteria TaxID=2 RepID=UPI0025FDFE34|nr:MULTISPECIES: AAA family ATPase [Bacteria]
MLKVTSLAIESFRRFPKNSEIVIGPYLTLIVGQNATSKSTLLGMLCQPFEFKSDYKVYTDAYNNLDKKTTKTIAGKLYEADFSDVFRMSPVYDNPDERKYTYYVNYVVDEVANSLIVNSEKRTDQKKNNVRFVVGKTRNKGEGNYPHPVIYLGLNRLYPLANSKKVEMKEDYDLTIDEKSFYSDWQKKITILNENIAPEFVMSDTKDFLACKTQDYDAETNSAGQDNLGQIISAVLSFRRLKVSLGNNYQGGLLLIDEIDATFHILAQEKLLDFLIESAKQLSLQIICTTHSQKIIEECCRSKKRDATIVALYRRGNDVLIKNDASYEDIMAELEAISSTRIVRQITTLFEDPTATSFFKYLTHNKLKKVIKIYDAKSSADISLPSDVLLHLASKRIPEFERIIFVIDGDKRNLINKNKHRHILALPGNLALEKEMYFFLNSLPQNDMFWSKELGQYNYQTCFRDFPNLNANSDINEFKKWFASQKEKWGRMNAKLYKRWTQSHKDEVINFIENFVRIFYKTNPYDINIEEQKNQILEWVKSL